MVERDMIDTDMFLESQAVELDDTTLMEAFSM